MKETSYQPKKQKTANLLTKGDRFRYGNMRFYNQVLDISQPTDGPYRNRIKVIFNDKKIISLHQEQLVSIE